MEAAMAYATGMDFVCGDLNWRPTAAGAAALWLVKDIRDIPRDHTGWKTAQDLHSQEIEEVLRRTCEPTTSEGGKLDDAEGLDYDQSLHARLHVHRSQLPRRGLQHQ